MALLLVMRTGDVDHMQKQVGFANFFKGGSKGRDQSWRQLIDESHCVRQDHLSVGRQFDLP